MAIYDKPVRLLIREMAAALASQKGQLFSKDQAIGWFAQHYPKIKEGTILAHLVRFSINAPSRLHYNVKADEDLLYQLDRSHFRLYDPSNDPAPIHSKEDAVPPTGEDAAKRETEGSSEFAYESDLRDFLAKNLIVIEPGLQLYQEEGITGIEFPVGGRSIDILECAIALAQFSAEFHPTVLVLDDGLHGLDQERRQDYLVKLNASRWGFQTVLIDVGAMKDIAWGGWQYVNFQRRN